MYVVSFNFLLQGFEKFIYIHIDDCETNSNLHTRSKFAAMFSKMIWLRSSLADCGPFLQRRGRTRQIYRTRSSLRLHSPLFSKRLPNVANHKRYVSVCLSVCSTEVAYHDWWVPLFFATHAPLATHIKHFPRWSHRECNKNNNRSWRINNSPWWLEFKTRYHEGLSEDAKKYYFAWRKYFHI